MERVIIKTEPEQERQKWALIAVSEAARKHQNRFELEPGRKYKVGRSRAENQIHLASQRCSYTHCELNVNDTEIILKDQSRHGTYVNEINYKGSRTILAVGDQIGFGCNPKNRHVKEKSDRKFFVYRVAIGNEIKSGETIELSSGEEDDDNANGFNQLGNNLESDDEDCPSADEMDIKPDIHSLMRQNYEQMKIKEEVDWNCYEYDRSQRNQTNDNNQVNNNGHVEEIYVSDTEDDVCMVEPPRKRIRNETIEEVYQAPVVDPPVANAPVVDAPIQLPEFHMSDATLKEKVKNAPRSRGQQLAADMLTPNLMQRMDLAPTKTTPKPSAPRQDNPIPSTSNGSNNTSINPRIYHMNSDKVDEDDKSVDDLRNDFISEITKWDIQWILNDKVNPLRFQMNIRRLNTEFTDLLEFQQQMKNFLLMETYSILLADYNLNNNSVFTELKSCEYNANVKRYVYKCFAKKSDCPVQIKINDFVVVTHSKRGKFLACVTQLKRLNDLDGWEYELQASPVDNKRNELFNEKFIQSKFATNIQTMLECYVSLHELRHSTLKEVFLQPSSQFEESIESDNFTETDRAEILGKIYEKCAVSLIGESKIFLVNGGAGTGKTTFIRDLLGRFAKEDFQFTNSILVCGGNNTLVDSMAAKVMPKIQSIARFGKKANMAESIQSIGIEKCCKKLSEVKIVFTTLVNVVDLLHANRSFDVCIVDDASLFSEAQILPLFRLKIRTLLLVGDEKLQTSKTQNECCREMGYSRSLFTRVIESYRSFDTERNFFPTLNQQYRMDPAICLWPNKQFYKNQLQIAKSQKKSHSTGSIPFEPYTLYQVNTVEDIEVDFVRQLLQVCFNAIDPKRCTYGIICGHPSTKLELDAMIKGNPNFAGVEISEHDSFQGQEKDVIIMLALKPRDGFMLFSTPENLLIALTRAKRSLIFCGNFQYVSTSVDAMSSTWAALMSDAKNRKPSRFVDLNGMFDKNQIISTLIA